MTLGEEVYTFSALAVGIRPVRPVCISAVPCCHTVHSLGMLKGRWVTDATTIQVQGKKSWSPDKMGFVVLEEIRPHLSLPRLSLEPTNAKILISVPALLFVSRYMTLGHSKYILCLNLLSSFISKTVVSCKKK